MLSQEQIEKLSKYYKIDSFSVQREYAQIIFLEGLYEIIASRKFIFKGGTALRLFLNGTRFSEDLDFTAEMEKDEIQKILDKALLFFKNYFTDAHFKKSKGLLFDDSHTVLLKFSLPGMPFLATIRIDVSMREKVLLEPIQKIVDLFGYPLRINRPIMQVMNPVEVVAEKIRACMHRDKYRDVYDLALLLQDNEIDIDIVNKKMGYYNDSFSKEKFLKKINNIDLNEMKKDLEKFLPISERDDNTYKNSIEIVKGKLN